MKWCRRNRYSTMFPELSIPKNARMGKKKILQPTALKVLFDVDTRLYYGKLVFDEYIYAYRFAVATGVRPGELVGLWYGDVKGTRSICAAASTGWMRKPPARTKTPFAHLIWARKPMRPTKRRWPC